MIRRRLSYLLVLCALIFVTMLQPHPASADLPSSSMAAAESILRQLNQWRVDNELMPLRPNAQLAAMAFEQAFFVYPRRDRINDEAEYHLDAQGRDILTRAQAVVRWPAIGAINQFEVGENAADGGEKFSLNFWKLSSIHARTALNPTYREVGVAALPIFKKGHLYYTNFGARPDVLTALLSPDRRTLFVSRETSRYSFRIKQKPFIQVFDSSGKALTQRIPWQFRVPLPEGLQGFIKVQWTLETQVLELQVNLKTDQALLPGSEITMEEALAATLAPLSVANERPAAQATRTPRVALPTNTPIVRLATATVAGQLTPTPQPTKIAILATATLTPASLASTATSTATLRATSTAASTKPADIILLYDANGLSVFNASKRALDLTALQVGRLTVQNWLQAASFPATAFPAGHCLQVSANGAVYVPPTQCRFIRSEIITTRPFWTQGTFTVSVNNAVVATCESAAKRCDVALP